MVISLHFQYLNHWKGATLVIDRTFTLNKKYIFSREKKLENVKQQK